MSIVEPSPRWWNWNRPLGRKSYFLIGAGLMLVKFAMDWSVSRFVFERDWKPWSYLFWPQHQRLTGGRLDDPQALALANTLLWLSVPFATMGVILTLRRLRDARLTQALVVLFFVPVVNWLFFLILSLAESRPPAPEPLAAADRIMQEHGRRARRPINKRAATKAVVLSITVTVLIVVLGTIALADYGMVLFVGSPFFLGFLAAMVHNETGEESVRSCVAVAMTAVTCVGVVLLLFAIEGLICLAMAAPLAYPMAFLGAVVGHGVSSRRSPRRQQRLLLLLLTTTMPMLMAAEHRARPEPTLWQVTTTVEINAPAETVWRNVVAFPPINEPPDWLFGAGVAYPQRAEIQGHGIGAVRHCIFSTGAFVEPIDVWDEPNVLRFRVVEQPLPMHEFSPWDIHPPHLDNYLVSREGEFRLTRLADGRTRLDGTTWYTNRMWPENYWRLWSDFIIHRIHGRVLEHIRAVSET
jgi:uncharacterized membrane protein YhaH (DUF805 family)